MQQTTVSLPAATATAGATATPLPVALPTAAGFTPTMMLPLPQTATNAHLTVGVSNVAPAAAPPLALQRFAQAVRRTTALPTGATLLLYNEIYSSATLTLPTAPGFTFVIPSGYVIAGANYDLALFDPTRPSLGWQYDFEGPATVTGTTLTFAANAAPFTLAGSLTYYFALYVIPQNRPQPTPAPSIAPTSVPTQAPPTAPPTQTPTATPTPIATPTSSPTPGGSISITLPIPSPAPIVCTPATLVVAVGSTLTVGCSAAGYAGSFHPRVDDQTIASVTVPPTPSPAPSPTPSSAPSPTPTPASTPSAAPTPTPTVTPAPTFSPAIFVFSITGLTTGSTTLRLGSDNGSVAAIALAVTP